ncbi:hypothetical protein [Nonomuraea dietziae]|uniref:hypothetical protein n=1 Tax=Nonomuraea dietziae TaxID=65515 RepID=UPI003434F129
MVADEACHAFGLAEVPLLDTNGTINRHHWDGPLQAIITNWASWSLSKAHDPTGDPDMTGRDVRQATAMDRT